MTPKVRLLQCRFIFTLACGQKSNANTLQNRYNTVAEEISYFSTVSMSHYRVTHNSIIIFNDHCYLFRTFLRGAPTQLYTFCPHSSSKVEADPSPGPPSEDACTCSLSALYVFKFSQTLIDFRDSTDSKCLLLYRRRWRRRPDDNKSKKPHLYIM